MYSLKKQGLSLVSFITLYIQIFLLRSLLCKRCHACILTFTIKLIITGCIINPK